ncbi:hypothetical protein CDAR_116171 [Caerostris darwini]|uniref:Transposase n=1 Tax=Caerostris darwini TaxID=1538125 RepID=A0AAV4SJA2_9ARAC|nr:hypothetical protein CDAR_116171 [Caerostris darwini]
MSLADDNANVDKTFLGRLRGDLFGLKNTGFLRLLFASINIHLPESAREECSVWPVVQEICEVKQQISRFLFMLRKGFQSIEKAFRSLKILNI